MAKKKKPVPVLPAWAKSMWWMIPLIAILVYLPAFNADFTLDDVLIVEENSFVKSLDKIPDIWTSHYWAGKIDATDTGLYRPLTLTSYNIQYAISGESPAPFHMLNILLHALVCFVLMKMAWLLFTDYRLVILSGLLFALHPLHTEAVAGIVGRAEILAALFILTSMIGYHYWRQRGTTPWLVMLLLSTFAAITSKEHGFLIAAILGLQETYYFFAAIKNSGTNTKKWTAIGGVTLLSIGMWIFRSTITGPSVSHELWVNVTPAVRMATALRTLAEYIGMHFWPWRLSADYWTDEVPFAGFGSVAVILSSFLLLAILAMAYYVRRKMPVVSWGLLFFLLTLVPVSNFLFAAGFLKAERILYIPSIGLIIVMAAIFIQLLNRKNFTIPVLVVLGIFVSFLTWRSWTRTGDWKNNYTLAVATLKTSPNSPRFNNMMGLELRAQKKNAKALVYFEKAVESNPRHVPALVNLGLEYSNAKRYPEAAKTLEKAIAFDPKSAQGYVNLMAVYRSLEDYDKNLDVAERALAMFPEFAPILWNAGNAYQLKGNMSRANELRARAQVIDPTIAPAK